MNRAALLLLPLAAACAHAPAPRADATLLLRVSPPQAAAYVDDLPVRAGPGEVTRVAVLPGLHRVEVRAEGYFTAYREIAVPPQGTAELVLPLRRDPDAP